MLLNWKQRPCAHPHYMLSIINLAYISLYNYLEFILYFFTSFCMCYGLQYDLYFVCQVLIYSYFSILLLFLFSVYLCLYLLYILETHITKWQASFNFEELLDFRINCWTPSVHGFWYTFRHANTQRYCFVGDFAIR